MEKTEQQNDQDMKELRGALERIVNELDSSKDMKGVIREKLENGTENKEQRHKGKQEVVEQCAPLKNQKIAWLREVESCFGVL